MKSLFRNLLISALAVASALAQTTTTTTTPPAVPTYIYANGTFNQIGQPRWNFSMGALYSSGIAALQYTATSASILPVLKTDPTTGRQYYSFTVIPQQTIFRTLYSGPKLLFLAGPGFGVSFSQASPSGTNTNLTASAEALAIAPLTKHWGLNIPFQAIYVNGGWNPIVGIGLTYKP